MSALKDLFRYALQLDVDRAYAKMGIRNRGKGRCMARPDSKNRGCFWVRVHGSCTDPGAFAATLLLIGTDTVKSATANGSGDYVVVWPDYAKWKEDK